MLEKNVGEMNEYDEAGKQNFEDQPFEIGYYE